MLTERRPNTAYRPEDDAGQRTILTEKLDRFAYWHG